jgi:myo-inositol-1-phosphate synthase
MKSRSLNPYYKNRNKLMRKTIAYNNIGNNNYKINLIRKRKYSFMSNKDDLISKIISGNL